MRHADVSYVDETGAPVNPEDVPLTPRGREQAAAARDALAGVELRPRRRERPAPHARDGGDRRARPRGRALARARRMARRPARRDPARGARGRVRRRAAGQDEAQRFLGGESLGEALDRVHPALERLLAREWDTALAVLHGGVNRIVISYALSGDRTYFGTFEQAPGVHQRPRPRRRRLDRAHGQLRPVRPAPPRADDDDGAPLGAAEAVPRRAPVAPRASCGCR